MHRGSLHPAGAAAGGEEKLFRSKRYKLCRRSVLRSGVVQVPGNIWLTVHSINIVKNADLTDRIPAISGEGKKRGSF